MKKLFTLVALLAMVLGANAQGGKWEKVYSVDYTTYQGFPFYVMGYVPEFDNGHMTDYGANYKYAEVKDDAEETSDVIVTTQGGVQYYRWTEGGGWHQYFIADGIPAKLDGKYKVIAKVKATNACTINVNMGWGWGDGQSKSASVSIPGDTEFQDVEWTYDAIGGTSCNLVAQPGGCTETIEWESLEVYEWQKEGQRPKEWLEDITNGDAETPWGELANVKFDDNENNFKVCAWSKERGVNLGEPDADGNQPWNPFPATIEVDPDNADNHVFVCHGKAATTDGSAAAWDNQFWIQSKHAWKAGTTLKIKFRYKASKEVETETQIHNQKPSDYLIWHAIGNVTFKEEWQTFEKDLTMGDDMNGGWSIAFNLNAKDKDAIDFYFDDLSWQYLKLDEGYFVSGINATTTTVYDNLDNAIQFEDTDNDEVLEAVVGTMGDAKTYVDQVMISTTRGDDQAFKGATLKPGSKIHNDADEWLTYAASTNAKLDLPGLGVWKIYIDLEYSSMAFEMLEGTEYAEKEPVEIVTNPSVLVVNALERQPTATEQPADPEAGIEAGTGQPWDNQFFIKANRVLKTDEVTVIEFDYVASQEAKSTTQCHALPGEYRGGGMGDVNFTTEEQHFIGEFKVPSHEKADIQTMVFNLAEIKDACQYTFKNIKWYLKSDQEGMTDENLIDAEGTANFSWIVVGGTGIENVTKNVKSSNVTYNLAGQRVSKDFKGIVVKDGKKFMNK